MGSVELCRSRGKLAVGRETDVLREALNGIAINGNDGVSLEALGRTARALISSFVREHREGLPPEFAVGPELRLNTEDCALVRQRSTIVQIPIETWYTHGGLIINALRNIMTR